MKLNDESPRCFCIDFPLSPLAVSLFLSTYLYTYHLSNLGMYACMHLLSIYLFTSYTSAVDLIMHCVPQYII